MWSVKQRRQIKKDILRELKQREESRSQPLSNGRNGRTDLEANQSLQSCHGERSSLHDGEPFQHVNSDSKASSNGQFLVTCGPEDTLNPQNWPLISRCKNLFILAFLIFTQGWAGGSQSMENSVASSTFHVSQTTESLDTAMYLFGVGTGAPFAGPLSETVGRNPVYLLATFCYLFFVLGSAKATTFGGRITCRYFVGLFASATLSINGSSVRDQFRDVKRAFVFPVIAWVNVIGEWHDSSTNATPRC